MKYLNMKLPGGNMNLSKIAMGTSHFGTKVSEESAFRLLDIFADVGGSCVDSARIYDPECMGASERTVGKWMKTRGNRNKIIISTKGGHPLLEQMNCGRLSRKEIESDLDDSLRALGVDVIDLYWLHRDDMARPVEDIMESLSTLITKGKVRAVGCSNWKVERIEEANRFALSNGLAPFSSSQVRWSLATLTPDAHDDPTMVCMDEKQYNWYLKENFPVFAFSSQAKGFFARASAGELDAIHQKTYARFNSQVNIARLERVKEYAAQNGLTPSAVTLGYILCNRVPAIAIIGCKNEDQLLDSLTAADVDLPETTAEWLFGK